MKLRTYDVPVSLYGLRPVCLPIAATSPDAARSLMLVRGRRFGRDLDVGTPRVVAL